MFSLVHKIFLEYFQNCDSKMRAEMIDLLAEHLVHMLHSKDGTQVALQCVWFGTAKVIFLNFFSNKIQFKFNNS
jgi:pumilio family protein 6